MPGGIGGIMSKKEENNDNFRSEPAASKSWLEKEKDREYRWERKIRSKAAKQPAETYTSPSQPSPSSYAGLQTDDAAKAVQKRDGRGRHFRILICISALLITVLVTTTCYIKGENAKDRTTARNSQLIYEEIMVEDPSFNVYENNKVTLENQAYTVLEADAVSELPSGEKMIAVYAQVESGNHVYSQEALEECYISFQTPEGTEYRLGIHEETLMPYVTDLGFTEEELLSIYGSGNGADEQGYLFYLVPEETSRITFYTCEKEEIDSLDVVISMYEKEMKVLGADEFSLDEILKERAQGR